MKNATKEEAQNLLERIQSDDEWEKSFALNEVEDFIRRVSINGCI